MDTTVKIYSNVLRSRLLSPGSLSAEAAQKLARDFEAVATPANAESAFKQFLTCWGSEDVQPVMSEIRLRLEELTKDKEVEFKAKQKVASKIKRMDDLIGRLSVEIADGKKVETIGGKSLKEKTGIEMYEAHGAQGWKNKKNFRLEIEVK